MATLAELRTLLTDLLTYDLDNVKAAQTDGAVSAANLTAQLNWAATTLGRRLYLYDPKVTWTASASEASYNLDSTSIFSKRLWKIMGVWVNGIPLWNRDRSGQGPWAMSELDETYPLWRDADDGVPCLWVSNSGKLLVYPPPTAAVVSDAKNYVSGLIVPNFLTTTTDDAKVYTDIPFHLHEAIAYLAAGRAASPVASEQSAWERLKVYAYEMAKEIEETARQNRRELIDIGTYDYRGSTITL
jgi:hypothetical protein